MTTWSAADPWVTPDEVLASDRLCDIDADYYAALDPPIDVSAIAGDAAQDASDILMLVSGRTITGVVTDTVRPVVPNAVWRSAYVVGVGPGGCGCNGQQFCPAASIYLDGPVTDITSVIQDGVALTPADYQIVNGNVLVPTADPATHAHRHWRPQQRLDLPSTELLTLEVVYEHGNVQANWMKDAAVEIAAELVRLHLHRDTKIPGAVTLSGGGTNISIEKVADQLKAVSSETFASVVRFIKLVNPAGLRYPVWAWSPDIGDVVDVRTFS